FNPNSVCAYTLNTVVVPTPELSTTLIIEEPTKPRLRNNEKSINGSYFCLSNNINISVEIIKITRQVIENVLNHPCSNPCVANNVILPISTANRNIPTSSNGLASIFFFSASSVPHN